MINTLIQDFFWGGGDLTDDLLCSYIVYMCIYIVLCAAAIRVHVLVNKLQYNVVMNKRCFLACVCNYNNIICTVYKYV